MAGKKRWDEILGTSARLFSDKGFRATSMDDIASELGITKPALYYYIKSKHDLLYAICESAIRELIDGVTKIMEAPGCGDEKLRDLIRWHVSMFSRRGDIINVYLADEEELPTEGREEIRDLSRRYESIYREVFQSAIEEGRFREIDVPIAVRAVSGMCNWLSSWYRQDGRLSAEDIAEVFFDLLLHGCEKTARTETRK